MERGVLVFEGVNGTPVTCGAGIGTVLTVDGQEFMHVAGGCWARADAPWVLVSDEELYVYVLVNGVDLPCVHLPYRRSCSL